MAATYTRKYTHRPPSHAHTHIHTHPQGAVVLAFMFSASWRLTVVTFVLVPVVLLLSKVRALHPPTLLGCQASLPLPLAH